MLSGTILDLNDGNDYGNDGNLVKVQLKIKLKIPVVALPANKKNQWKSWPSYHGQVYSRNMMIDEGDP